MKFLTKIIFVFIILPTAVMAQNNKSNSFGFEIHGGTIDAAQTGLTNELNDVDTLHFLLRYDYHFTKEFSLGIGYLNGDSSDYTSIINLFTNSHLEYEALMLNAKYQFALSKRNRLYIQASGIQYDYDILDNNTVVTNNDDTDYGAALGWAFEFSNGVGLNVGYNYLRLGSDVKVRTTNFGVSYRF